jgi:hypothetical protein
MGKKKYNVEQMIQEALHNEWVGKTIHYDYYLDTNKIMVSDVEPKRNACVINVKVETILGKHHIQFQLQSNFDKEDTAWIEVISFFRNTF